MTMHTYRYIAVAYHALLHCSYEICKFGWQRVPDRIGNIEYGRAFVGRGVKNFAEKFDIAARCIFGRKLDVLDMIPGSPHSSPGHRDDFPSALFQLELQVDVGS